MKRSLIFILSLCLAVVTLTASYNGKKARKGRTLPAWSEGYLDIHTISTGRGECIFLILPDGTSIVVDAGEFSREGKKYKNVLLLFFWYYSTKFDIQRLYNHNRRKI